jgi:indole-3-glycerol phosphate synthase
MILDDILKHKAQEVAERKRRVPESSVRERAARAAPPLDLRGVLAGPGVSVISEIKRASPAKGGLNLNLDPAGLAGRYVTGGAAAISVLTDERFFSGSDADLQAVRAAVTVPVLRKDFVVDSYQVYEARAIGADAVLLIVRALSRLQLRELQGLARDLGMSALVEVHSAEELQVASDVGASLVGINNRDLTRMVVDLETTARLRPLVPAGVVLVSESGIRSADDVRYVAALGVDAILVGESLVTAPDPVEQLRELVLAGQSSVGMTAAP